MMRTMVLQMKCSTAKLAGVLLALAGLLCPAQQVSALCPPRSAQWDFLGASHADSVGFSEAGVKDVNGDSFDDFLVSASGFNLNQGKVHLFLGSVNGLGTTPFWTVLGEGSSAFGQKVALAGDVNGDSHPDILISAPGHNGGRGRAYLFPGSASGPSTSASWTFSGTFPFQAMGREIAGAGDVNHDGFDDVLVASGDGSSDGGRVFLFYGSTNGLSLAPVWTMEADRSSARFGSAIAGIGDVDADGFDDVAIASTWYESIHGRVFVFHGSPDGLPTDLHSSWSVVEPPTFSAPAFGESIAGVGDVNKDGFADLVIGAPYHGDPLPEEGVVFLYLGSEDGLAMTPAWHASSHVANARLGNSVAGVGDFNGDGFNDLVAGAYLLEDEMGVRKGAAYVFLGNSFGLGESPAFCILGEQQDEWHGFSVATAGDVNSDGYSDFVVGAVMFTTEAGVVGRVALFAGESSPLIFSDGFESGSTETWSATTP